MESAWDFASEREDPQRYPPRLLAVDVGLRTGLALFRHPNKLLEYRSAHWANRSGMRRAVWKTVASSLPLEWLVLEGDGPLARIWIRTAEHFGIQFLKVPADEWRRDLLWPRELRTAAQAKRNAIRRARDAIAWAHGPRPVSLGHHAAEAILLGCWALWRLGWAASRPDLRLHRAAP